MPLKARLAAARERHRERHRLRMTRGRLTLMLALALGGCATAPSPAPVADSPAIEECRDFAERTAPRAAARGAGAGRSMVYPKQDPESLATLFDLCMKAKEALK
jgi:hypothetical protein